MSIAYEPKVLKKLKRMLGKGKRRIYVHHILDERNWVACVKTATTNSRYVCKDGDVRAEPYFVEEDAHRQFALP